MFCPLQPESTPILPPGGIAVPSIAGVVLLPGAGGTKEHPTLRALEDSLAPLPVVRHEFSYRREGKRTPPRAPKLVSELFEECQKISAQLGCDPADLVFGGRSMGGRVCSMAVAEGMSAAGLVLLSYPLHPPSKPDKLRVDHFGAIDVPCLFVSGDNDPFGSPTEFESHLDRINSDVSAKFLKGGRHDPSNRSQRENIVEAVSEWLAALP